MIRRPPRSTLSSSSAASDVYKRQADYNVWNPERVQGQSPPYTQQVTDEPPQPTAGAFVSVAPARLLDTPMLSLIHISEPTRLLSSSYAVFCLKKKSGKGVT